MAIEKEITLTFSDRLQLHETTNELKDLIKEYNFKLIDKGLAVKRSQLRKNDTINVQDICNYIYDDEWSLPEIPFNKFEIEKTICEMPDLWHYLIPCFKTGILQLNKARYIYFDVIDTNTENKSITVELIDYSHDNAIWQRGISETVTFKLKDFNQDTFQKKMSSYSTQLLLKQKSNTSRNEVFTKICIAVLSNFIRDVITETNQMTYADIYKLLSIDDLKWTKYQYDMWEKIIIKYSQKFLDLTERQRSFDSLLLQYTAFIITSNIAIEQTKAYPDKIQEQYVKSKTTEPDKIITTIQNIKFTSKEPVKLIKDETVTKHVVTQQPSSTDNTTNTIRKTKLADSIYRRKSITKIKKEI